MRWLLGVVPLFQAEASSREMKVRQEFIIISEFF